MTRWLLLVALAATGTFIVIAGITSTRAPRAAETQPAVSTPADTSPQTPSGRQELQEPESRAALPDSPREGPTKPEVPGERSSNYLSAPTRVTASLPRYPLLSDIKNWINDPEINPNKAVLTDDEQSRLKKLCTDRAEAARIAMSKWTRAVTSVVKKKFADGDAIPFSAQDYDLAKDCAWTNQYGEDCKIHYVRGKGYRVYVYPGQHPTVDEAERAFLELNRGAEGAIKQFFQDLRR